ncbi:hypothetical protein [Leucobacter ruminantium]|uniref:Uncharacterized protein n=1 Tax=Leucobacter ruminantium TaxID=1289170 RepID=A0A939LTM6_9MICO|nr:hypothetical protein [Leucobacter ruminantium]MBO1804544.1 hypothetical protein [Leucobacter ruminantium]
MKRMTCAEITAAIQVGLPFTAAWHQKMLTATPIQVLTSTLGAIPGNRLSGPLAHRVRESEQEYTIQYLTDGGRKRLPSDVAYYISQHVLEPDCQYVLAIITANGRSSHVTNADPHPAAPELLAAITAGLRQAGERVGKQIRHDDELHDADARSDAGWTFELLVRPTKSAICAARPVATFDNRSNAYRAMVEASRARTLRHAWVERYENHGPLYGVALGHGSFDCLGADLVTEVTRNARQARRNLVMLRLAQPGAEIALAIKRPGDGCYRVGSVPVAQWIRSLAEPPQE